jgi:hypothetical protein
LWGRRIIIWTSAIKPSLIMTGHDRLLKPLNAKQLSSLPHGSAPRTSLNSVPPGKSIKIG